MRNTKKENIEALEALMQTIKPAQAEETLTTLFLGYIPTDDFCEARPAQRHNIVFAANELINFFKKLGGSNE